MISAETLQVDSYAIRAGFVWAFLVKQVRNQNWPQQAVQYFDADG